MEKMKFSKFVLCVILGSGDPTSEHKEGYSRGVGII